MDIGSRLRKHWIEIAWAAFAAANVGVILTLTNWETVPFHFIWVSLTIVYGFRVWSVRRTAILLAVVMAVTCAALFWTVTQGNERLDELTEVPLMAAMFVAMVWHARRRHAAMEEVRRLADRQLQLLERQREFVRDASHELRTPITVAVGHAELIRAAHAGDQAGEDAGVVLDELGRLSRMSERLLILAAAGHADFLRPVGVDLGAFVNETLRRWAPTSDREWSATLETSGSVPADHGRLQLAVDALLENAVKFTRDGGRIEMRVTSAGEVASIEVIDDGCGIPRDHQDRVFERFARVDDGRARGSGGTGLGLAIVKAIAEAHGGSVGVRSVAGRGASFVVRLPGFEAHPGAAPPGPVAAPVDGAASVSASASAPALRAERTST